LKIGITKKERDIMSKNLTRKGLALGAVVALGASVFAGSPAFAANELNVAPSAGTSYNAVAGSVFNLATTFAPGFTPSSYAQLKYIVKSDANSAIKYGVGVAAVTAPATAQAISLSSAAVVATGASATTVNYLGLSADTTTVTSAIEVTAFVDANNDGAVTAGEWNTVKTVTFKKLADIVPVVTLTQPSTGDSTVSATVAWGDLNYQQAGVGVVATGSTNSVLGLEFKHQAGSYAAATAYNSTTGAFTKSQAIADSDVVSAQAVWATNTYVSTPTNTYSSTVLGSAASATAAVRSISSLTGAIVAGNDATSAGVVRTNGSFVAKVTALNTATTPVAAPAVAVVATFATTATLVPASTGVDEKSVTVNGTKYTTNAALTAASVALTTDASGVATVAISSTGLVATNTITVSYAAQNRTASAVATQTAAAYTVTDDGASTVVATNKNTATTLTYSVKDQFGVLSARTNERLVVTATTAATVTQYVAVVAGKASFVVTPVTDSTASIAVSSVLQASTTDVVTGTTWATAGTNTVTNTINIRSAAYAFTVAPAIDATNGINNGVWTLAGAQKQSLTTVNQADTAAVGYVAPAASATYAKVTLTGSNAGEKLTVSGTDVFLSIDGAAVAKNSASKVAQAATAVIYVASNTTGAKTLTVTNGSVSATVVVTFDAAVVANRSAIALGDLATSSQAGRSVDVTAVVTDAFGNAVAGATASLSATGVGYLANTTATSDASGKIVAKLVVGAAETGDAVVTATVTLADATVKTVSKTVTFGSTDSQIDIVGKRVTAVASFSKGKTVSFYVDGIKKWSKLSASDADVVLNYNLKKGTHTITVKISGGFVTTERFIVK
jgi:hypothetical protein